MSDFLQQALRLEPDSVPAWLSPFRRETGESNAGLRLPTRRVEEWKYTSLKALEEGEYLRRPQPGPVDADVRDLVAVSELDAHTLVFVNGVFNAALSDSAALPGGCTLVPFSGASETEAAAIREHLGSLAPSSQPFVALNNHWLEEGVFLRVDRNTRVSKPLQLVWLTTPQDQSFSIAQRLLVVLEEGSEATVLEHFASSDSRQNAFTTGVTEMVVGANACLHHYRLHLEQSDALHIGAVHVELARDARINGYHVALGSTLKRIDLVVHHRGQGAHSELNGIYVPRNDELVDYHTTLEHEVPHTSSEETFRGIVSDRARAVFSGRIHIHPHAQKTSAHLNNRNLLTSNTAEVDTKPELEIYADDVQCSHGATVAQIDAGQLHYLRTRGVPQQEAEVLLSFGFLNELLNRSPLEPVRQYLRPRLAEQFARDPNLTRHLL